MAITGYTKDWHQLQRERYVNEAIPINSTERLYKMNWYQSAALCIVNNGGQKSGYRQKETHYDTFSLRYMDTYGSLGMF